MQELKIAPTKNTPEVFMCPTGVIRIKGRSIHETVSDFFIPVEAWINKYIATPAQITTVDLILEYFNSSSSKALIQMLHQIKRVASDGKSFVINWYYEDGDDDIHERGEYFASVLDVPMNFIKI